MNTATQYPIVTGSTPTGHILWKYGVTTFDDLASIINQRDGDVARVINSQGTKWLPGSLGGTYYPSGFYTWNETGAVWEIDKAIEEIANVIQTLVDKDPGKSLLWQSSSFNPADSTTYYFCAGQTLTPSPSSNGNRRHKISVAASEFTLNVSLACNGTNEGVTWTIRNYTKETSEDFDTLHAWNSGGQANSWNGKATLSCDVDDFIEVTCDTPIWSTNPIAVRLMAILNY